MIFMVVICLTFPIENKLYYPFGHFFKFQKEQKESKYILSAMSRAHTSRDLNQLFCFIKNPIFFIKKPMARW